MALSRTPALLALITATLVVSGCVSVRPGPAITSDAPAPIETGDADDTGTPGGSGAPDALTFADGDALTPGTRVEWGDSLFAKEGYTLSIPDDGNGSWGYTQDATQCTILFWQGSYTGADAADDRGLSDSLLATWLEATLDEVTTYADDDVVGYQLGGNGAADVRIIASGSETDGETVSAARGIRSLEAGFLVDVSCPAGQDADAVYFDLADESLALVLTPGF